MGILGVVVLIVGLALWRMLTPAPQFPPGGPDTGEPGDYLFCFWNVENLFDDRDDGNRPVADKKYDDWFGRDAESRQEKYDHLAEAMTKLNNGRGPDILACAEVESPRAAELLKDALNAKLADPNLHYSHVEMKDLTAGRHIAPCLISRVPVSGNRTTLLGSRLRILRTQLHANGHDLTVIVSHWTSQLRREGRDGDETHGEEGRTKYADQIYGEYRAMSKSNPAIDLLVCGDFNTTPDDETVKANLHAVHDRAVLDSPNGPWLWDLMGGKDPHKFGTIYYKQPLIYDHICVSPGMLDGTGWSVEPDTFAVVDTLVKPGDKRREPWRFGNPDGGKDKYGKPVARGYSDHFPVTVRLKVQ
jgi:endonuclease/exonuclease/phosphatase family metal-dependent hydrolase